MRISTRVAAAVSLGLVGVGCLVGPSLAQRGGQDGDVKKAANAPAATAKPAALAVGTVDIEKVMRDYDKFKAQQEEFQALAMKKQQDLMKLQSEGQDGVAKLQKMTPNSVDAKKIEDHLTQIKAQMEAAKEQGQRELSLRETEIIVQTYKEVVQMIGRIAEYKGLTYVMKVSGKPVSANNPDSAFAEMSKTVVYSDPRSDITNMVIVNLNSNYKGAGGIAPKGTAATKAATGAPAPPAPSPRP